MQVHKFTSDTHSDAAQNVVPITCKRFPSISGLNVVTIESRSSARALTL